MDSSCVRNLITRIFGKLTAIIPASLFHSEAAGENRTGRRPGANFALITIAGLFVSIFRPRSGGSPLRKLSFFLVGLILVSLALTLPRVSKPKAATPPHAAAMMGQPNTRPNAAAHSIAGYGRLPLSFEANQGQTDGRVKFVSRGRGYALFLTGDEAVLALRSQKSGIRSQDSGVRSQNRNSKLDGRNSKLEIRNSAIYPIPLSQPGDARLLPSSAFAIGNLQSSIVNPRAPSPESQAPEVLRMKLVGANTGAQVVGLDELPGKSNYFIGNDPSKWRTNVANYAKVKYRGVYPGVDLVYYGHEGQMEYDFVVAPGADPGAIQLAINNGASKLENRNSKIAANGDLVIATAGGEVRFHKPVVYQEDSGFRSQDSEAPNNTRHSPLATRHFLDGHYVLRADNRVGFEVPAYDHAWPLVIDPVLVYSTYLGGSGDEEANGIAVDSAGNAYVTGTTYSTNFPTSNAIQANNAGGRDVFVTKLSPDGSALVYSTFLGGTGNEWGNMDHPGGIAVDAAGDAYVVGDTTSADFPVANALYPSYSGAQDAFVAKLNATGSALIYSTYLGGSGMERGHGIAVDSTGNAYLTGNTTSADFPTANALQPQRSGGYDDIFVSKLDASGSALVYSTYLGGASTEDAYCIAVDSAGNAYIAGLANSPGLATANAFQTAPQGGNESFVAKLNSAGSALIYFTYLGGYSEDRIRAIAVDSAGNAYVTGRTESTNFPVANALQPAHAGGGGNDAFVTKLDPTGSQLVFSTYFGGTGGDEGSGIAVDSAGKVYFVGVTGSSDLPMVDPLVPSKSPTESAFVARLSASGSTLEFSTYLGEHWWYDTNYAIAVYSSGAYVAGHTISTNFLPMVNALQPANAGGFDAFVAKIQFSPVTLSPGIVNLGGEPLDVTSNAQSVTLTNGASTAVTISSINIQGTNAGDFAQTNDCPALLDPAATCTINVTFTPTAAGSRTATLSVSHNALGSPATAALQGTGLVPAAGLSPTTVAFANQLVGIKSASQTVTLRNTGGAPLAISGIGTSGDFGQTNNCVSTVAVGASCAIQVTFTPTAAGLHIGSLSVSDNAAGSPQSVALQGTGIAPVPDMTISVTHSGSFTQGQAGAGYTITVSNVGSLATSGTVTAVDTLPAGLTATALAGTGWSCTLGTLSCTRSDVLGVGASYPTITLTVTVAANAPSLVTTGATVAGGGEVNTSNDVANDPTSIALKVVSGTINLATGLDCSNQLITTSGKSDCHWTVDQPGGGIGAAQTVWPGSAQWFNATQWFGPWVENGPNSVWVARSASTLDSGRGTRTFYLNFDLTGYDLSKVSILGFWTVDDGGTLSLNGNTLATLPNFISTHWYQLNAFSVPSGSPLFNQGINTLTITESWDEYSHEGVRLEGTLFTGPPTPVDFTIQTSPSGLAFSVDGTGYTSSQTFSWTPYSTHSVNISSPQSAGPGTQYVFSGWADGPTSNPRTFIIPVASATFTAKFLKQYLLTAAISPPGTGTATVNPMPWSQPTQTYVNAGVPTPLVAIASIGWVFDYWSVSPPENGTLTNPTSAGATVTLSGPATVTANFGLLVPPTIDSLTPTSASGPNQTFSLTFSTHNGRDYKDVVEVSMLFSPAMSNVQQCQVVYTPSSNQLFLMRDAGGEWQEGWSAQNSVPGSLTPGSAGTLSNSQCTINGAGTTVTASGPTLTLNLSVTASPGFLGTKNIYAVVDDVWGMTSYWQKPGTWTPNADTPPTADAVTPTPASGANQTFSLSYSTHNGKDYTDLIDVQALFSPAMSDVQQCHVEYVRGINQLFLFTDAGARNRLPGSITPGSAATLSNSQCTINGAGTTVVGSGPTLTLNLSVTASPTFLGTRNIYMVAENSTTLTSGWQIRGTWTPKADTPPTADVVTPTPASGTNQTFSLSYSTHNGKDYTDLIDVQVLFSPAMSDVQQCHVEYVRGINQLFLFTDAGARNRLPGSITPGSAATLSNSQCTINGAGTTVVGSGPTLTLNLSVTASANFLGTRNIYMVAENSATLTSGWQIRGTWTPKSDTPPTADVVTPTPASGANQTFSLSYSSQNGKSYTDLIDVQVLFSPAMTDVQQCHVEYVRGINQLFLYTDAGARTRLPGSITPGSAATLSNSQCTINGAGTTVVGSGPTLTLNLSVTASANFLGTRNIYMVAEDSATSTSGWQIRGIWTPQ